MNNLSDAFHELAQRDERAFAHAPRDAKAISQARKARHRTRAAQATGGTFAVGALAVGGLQLLPGSDVELSAAASPSASPSPSSSVATEGSDDSADSAVASEAVTYDMRRFDTIALDTLEMLDGQFQCGAAAPTPTSGAAELTIESVDIREEDFVLDLEPYINGTKTGPLPIVNDSGDPQWAMTATSTIAGTGGDALYADLPSTVALLVKNGEIVATMGAYQNDPTEPMEMIPAPEDSDNEWAQDQPIDELGAHPVLNVEPASFTTGYDGWDCPGGFGDSAGDMNKQVFPPLSDYLEPGDYELYVVGRVLVDDHTAAEHVLRDKGFELWNGWTEKEQAEKLGLDFVDGPVDEEHGLSYLQIDVPVPADHLPSEATDEIVVSEPVTVTVK